MFSTNYFWFDLTHQFTHQFLQRGFPISCILMYVCNTSMYFCVKCIKYFSFLILLVFLVLDFLCVLSQFVFRDNIAKDKYFFFFEWLFWRSPPLTCITNLNFPLLFPIICQACATQSVKSVPGLAHKTLSDKSVFLHNSNHKLRHWEWILRTYWNC